MTEGVLRGEKEEGEEEGTEENDITSKSKDRRRIVPTR